LRLFFVASRIRTTAIGYDDAVLPRAASVVILAAVSACAVVTGISAYHEAPAPDAATDGGADGAAPTDATPDVARDPFCVRNADATACVDFEDGLDVPDGYSPRAAQGASVRNDTRTPFDGRRSGLMVMDGGSGDCAYADFYRGWPGAFDTLHFELWLKRTPGTNAALMTLGHGGSGPHCFYIFEVDDTGADFHFQYLLPDGGQSDHLFPLDGGVAPGEWTKVQLDLLKESGAFLLRFYIGDRVFVLTPAGDSRLPTCAFSDVHFSVGMFCAGAISAELMADDIALYRQ
jgi:hypothetical protein